MLEPAAEFHGIRWKMGHYEYWTHYGFRCVLVPSISLHIFMKLRFLDGLGIVHLLVGPGIIRGGGCGVSCVIGLSFFSYERRGYSLSSGNFPSVISSLYYIVPLG